VQKEVMISRLVNLNKNYSMGAYFDTVYGDFTYESVQAFENAKDVLREEFDWVDEIDFYLNLNDVIFGVHVFYNFVGSVSYSDSETIPLIFEGLLEQALSGCYEISCEELEIVEYNSKMAEKNFFVQRTLPSNIEAKHLVFPSARKIFRQGETKHEIYSGKVDVDGFSICFFQGEFFKNVKSEFFQEFSKTVFTLKEQVPYIAHSFLINQDEHLNERKLILPGSLIFDVFAIETTNLVASNTFHPSTRGASFWQNSLEADLHEIEVGAHRLENCLKIKHSYVLANMNDVANGYEKNFEYDEENAWYYDPKEICYTYWQEERGLMAFSIIKNGEQEDYICTKMEIAPKKIAPKQKTKMKENELSDKKSLDENPKEPSTAVMNAVLIGIVIGIIIYSVAKNKLGFFGLIPLLVVFKMFNKSKQKSD
jgi:hypothetical protein